MATVTNNMARLYTLGDINLIPKTPTEVDNDVMELYDNTALRARVDAGEITVTGYTFKTKSKPAKGDRAKPADEDELDLKGAKGKPDEDEKAGGHTKK